jgi:hypothetical protein
MRGLMLLVSLTVDGMNLPTVKTRDSVVERVVVDAVVVVGAKKNVLVRVLIRDDVCRTRAFRV